MTRVSFAIALIVILSLALACAGSGFKEGPITVTGTAVMIGNEPFTAISLKTPDGNTYRLQADSVALAVFRLNQGREFQVAGIVKKEPAGPALLVETYIKK